MLGVSGSLWIVLLIAAAVFGTGVIALRHRRAGPAPSRTQPILYNVELPDPDLAALHLACPRCGFSGPLDDPSLIGESVDCPACEEPFLISEPESPIGTQAGCHGESKERRPSRASPAG